MTIRKLIAIMSGMTVCACSIPLSAGAEVLEPEIVCSDSWNESYYIDDDTENAYPYLKFTVDIYNDGSVEFKITNDTEWNDFSIFKSTVWCNGILMRPVVPIETINDIFDTCTYVDDFGFYIGVEEYTETVNKQTVTNKRLLIANPTNDTCIWYPETDYECEEIKNTTPHYYNESDYSEWIQSDSSIKSMQDYIYQTYVNKHPEMADNYSSDFILSECYSFLTEKSNSSIAIDTDTIKNADKTYLYNLYGYKFDTKLFEGSLGDFCKDYVIVDYKFTPKHRIKDNTTFEIFGKTYTITEEMLTRPYSITNEDGREYTYDELLAMLNWYKTKYEELELTYRAMLIVMNQLTDEYTLSVEENAQMKEQIENLQFNPLAADYNGDGKLTIVDAVILLKALAEQPQK